MLRCRIPTPLTQQLLLLPSLSCDRFSIGSANELPAEAYRGGGAIRTTLLRNARLNSQPCSVLLRRPEPAVVRLSRLSHSSVRPRPIRPTRPSVDRHSDSTWPIDRPEGNDNSSEVRNMQSKVPPTIQRSFSDSYTRLDPLSRLKFALGMFAFSCAAVWMTYELERRYPAQQLPRTKSGTVPKSRLDVIVLDEEDEDNSVLKT
ncbi:hypothetical protein DFJ73DRAFT_845674 [Zopfochytrium polystomum]|nr:hypothetical protein DFJ73DRAFT_845674 [Zopfochytrium polystomum]